MGYLHDHAPAGAVNGESSDLDSVLVLDRLHKWGFADNLHKLFAGISVLIDLTDISRSHRLVQGDVDGQVNAAEPGSATLMLVPRRQAGEKNKRGRTDQ